MKSVINAIGDKIASYLDAHTRQIFDVDEGKLKHVPRVIIWLVYIMSANVLIQGIVDIILKVGGYTPFMVKLPWRMDFLFLTAVSVLMGYQTLLGMRRRELDVTRNSVQIGLVVEVGLVIGDIWFIYLNRNTIPSALLIRAPFIVFTTLNIFILSYLVYKLNLFKDTDGHWQLF